VRWSATVCIGAALLTVGSFGCGKETENDDGRGAAVMRPTPPVVGQGLPPETSHPARAAIDRLQQAFADNDYRGLCSGMTSAAAHQAGEAGHGRGTTCERDVRRLLGMIRKGGGWRHPGAPRVTAVDEDGSKAVVTVALDQHWKARVPMTRQAGRWRLSGMFGSSRPSARRAAAGIAIAEFPPPGSRAIAVTGAGGSPCPELSEGQYPRTSGGCSIRVTTGSRIPLNVLTAFGDFRFDQCAIAFRVRVDASGRTWTDKFDALDDPRSVACGDVNSCYDFEREWPAPWRGRIYPDGRGGFLHRIDMCLQTCVGNFIGKLTMRLERDDNGWRATPVDGGGSAGFRFDSPFGVEGELDIEPADT
jgi:hypothetical protein